MVYVIVQDPAPAVAGLKVPVDALVIPVPLHVPPAGEATILNAAVPVQTAATGVIVAVPPVVTTTGSVSVFEHPLASVYE